MPGTMITVDGVAVEHWPFRQFVVEADGSDPAVPKNTNLTDVQVVARHPITREVLTGRNADTGDPVSMVTDGRGETPNLAYFPAPQIAVQAPGSKEYIVTTEALGGLVQDVKDSAAGAEAASGAAASSEQAAQEAAATVAGFNSRLTAAEQEAAKVAPAVEQVNTAAAQAVEASNQVATFESRIAALEAGGTGGGGTGGGDVFVVRAVNGAWQYPTLADAQAAGYVPVEQVVLFLGTAAGPDWAPEDSSVFLRQTKYDRVA